MAEAFNVPRAKMRDWNNLAICRMGIPARRDLVLKCGRAGMPTLQNSFLER